MERLKSIFLVVVGFGIILSIPASIYFIGKEFFSFLSAVDKTVAAAIIAASGTTIAAVFTVVIGHSINKKREIEDAHRSYKIKLYSKFIDFTIDWVFKNSGSKTKAKEEKLQKELEAYFIEFSKELTLWASPGVIKAWSNFRDRAGQENPVDILLSIDQIYRAMRKDLGNSNFGLDKKALIMLFLNEDRHATHPNKLSNPEDSKIADS